MEKITKVDYYERTNSKVLEVQTQFDKDTFHDVQKVLIHEEIFKAKMNLIRSGSAKTANVWYTKEFNSLGYNFDNKEIGFVRDSYGVKSKCIAKISIL